MAVLKHTSPTACPVAPRPKPSSTVPSASTRSAVGSGSTQPDSSCLPVMRGLHSREGPHGQRHASMSGILKSMAAVRIFVDDLDRARFFYGTVLELREESVTPERVVYELDGKDIVVEAVAPDDP